MLITIKTGGMWENEGKIEKWEFVKSRDFIRYFILRLKHCHMIMTWHQSSHIIVNEPRQRQWRPPPSLPPHLATTTTPWTATTTTTTDATTQIPSNPTSRAAYELCHTPRGANSVYRWLAAGKFFSSFLSLFYELTNCFYLSFRLTTTLQPRNGTPYAQLAMPPFLDDGVAIRHQRRAGETLGGP